jgi:hypothetical protein
MNAPGNRRLAGGARKCYIWRKYPSSIKWIISSTDRPPGADRMTVPGGVPRLPATPLTRNEEIIEPLGGSFVRWLELGNISSTRSEMKRAGRFFFLLTFALLQCVSPLAHAHIGGDASGGAFHVFHFNKAHQLHAHDHMARMSNGGHRFHASELPDGKRRNQANAVSIASPLIRAGIRLPAPAPAEKFSRQNGERIPLPPPYLNQYAQAPPGRA